MQVPWTPQAVDVQCHFFVPCPTCGHRQHLEFKHLRWDKGRPETAVYVCSENGCVIEEGHKTTMLAKGGWVATRCTVPGCGVTG